MKNALLIVGGLALLFVSACGTVDHRSGTGSGAPADGQSSGNGPESEQPSGQKNEKAIVSAKNIDKRLLEANNAFAFRLYENVWREDAGKNVFLSPVSVSLALAMTYNGADAETKRAMAETLGVKDVTVAKVNRGYNGLLNVLAHADPSVQLSIANSLWGREGTPFKKDFLKRAEQFYEAKVTALDFDQPQAAETINEWVSERTKGKIKEMIDSDIDPETILFLINAIYFKGSWTEAFDEKETSDDLFYLSGGGRKTVPMMGQSGMFPYYKGADFAAVQLPYGNKRFSMTVVLPDESSSLDKLHKKLNGKNWRQWQTHLKLTQGQVQLPRFQVTYEKQLNDVLKALGMEVAFDKNRANFSRIADIPPNIFVKEVKHKAVIEVNEKGTEAVAATSVEMQTESAPVDAFTMKVDRPFLFTIQENETGTVLFIGAVGDPQQSYQAAVQR